LLLWGLLNLLDLLLR
jgi:hypothetical protein